MPRLIDLDEGVYCVGGRNFRLALVPVEMGTATVTVDLLVGGFEVFGEQYYRHADGTPTSEMRAFKPTLKILRQLFGVMNCLDFGPLCLEQCQGEMIGKGWKRKSINSAIGRIKHVFRWGVSKELFPPSVYEALRSVAGLRAGRSDAVESQPVHPVADDLVDATVPFMSRVVSSMVQVQRLTGARPGEICDLCTGHLQMAGEIWLYQPPDHKTLHHEHERTIFIGYRAQQILLPFLKLDVLAPCFSPIDSERERRAAIHAARRTPAHHGNNVGTNRKENPRRQPHAFYTTDSYRRAIIYACNKGGLPKWNPHQLRHTAATEIRAQFGIEAAQHVLGHKHISATEIYAEKQAATAMRVVSAIG